jgi:acetoacetate decarboxylase
MKLKHSEGWCVPPDSPFYPQLPAMYRNVRMQFVFFHAATEAVSQFLPDPLIAVDDGLCVAGGIDVPFCTNYGPFQESLLLMKCRFQSREGFYCSHVFHNGPAGIAAGREIYGTPKIFAQVQIQNVGPTLRTESSLAGVPVLQISSTMHQESSQQGMPALVPAWRLKMIPRADGPGPAIKQLIDCAKVTRDLEIHFQAKGQGRISLGASPLCDLTPLVPIQYSDAYYIECSYSEGYAEVAYDYLRQSDGEV